MNRLNTAKGLLHVRNDGVTKDVVDGWQCDKFGWEADMTHYKTISDNVGFHESNRAVITPAYNRPDENLPHQETVVTLRRGEGPTFAQHVMKTSTQHGNNSEPSTPERRRGECGHDTN